MSKRLLSAICLFIVLFCPLVARAEMTVDLTVVGSSTSTATSATCGNASPSSNIAAGDPVIAAVFAHTTGVGTSGNTTVASVSDSDGNTWVRLAEYSTAVGGTNDYLVGLYLTVLAAQLATSDTVACNTGNGSSIGKVLHIYRASFSGGGQTYQNDGASGSNGNSTSYTSTAPTVSNVQRVWIGAVVGRNTAGTLNCDSNFACGGQTEADNGNANQSVRGLFGWATLTTTGEAFNGTISGTQQWGAIVVALDEISVGGGASTDCQNLLLTGVGGPCSA